MATLTVNNTHDYSTALLRNITLIDFTNPLIATATATFTATQLFSSQAFSRDLIIDGSAGRNEIVITNVGGGNASVLEGWTFTNWGDNDLLTQLGTTGGNSIQGSSVKDAIFGGDGDDNLNYNLTNGLATATDGDRFYGGSGHDVVHLYFVGHEFASGGSGEDFLFLHGNADTDLGLNVNISDGGGRRDIGDGTRLATFEQIIFYGADGNDTVVGGDLFDEINGGDGNDIVDGGGSGDLLDGGLGADLLTGGGGADNFSYTIAFDAIPLPGGIKANQDTITDFQQGTDLFIFFCWEVPIGEDFSFIGAQDFHNHILEVRAHHTLTATLIQVDVDGDGALDFQIKLNGAYVLTAADFAFNIENP